MSHKMGWGGTAVLAIAGLVLLGKVQPVSVAAVKVEPPEPVAAAAAIEPRVDAAAGARWNDAARMLAGLEPEVTGPYAAVAKRSPWPRHRRELDTAWKSFVERRLGAMERFAARELDDSISAGPVYYPFSGPDALHALALLPKATDFIFTGLEPVGELPELATMDEAVVRESLFRLRRSLGSVLEWSFFRTHEMKVDLVKNQLEGVTPIIMLFVARHGYAIHAVEPIALDPSGALREGAREASAAQKVPGVRVRFGRPGEPEKRIVYLSTDISDVGLAKTPHYVEYVKKSGFKTTLIKSASYLMHDDAFSRVRGLILEKSRMVVQDDSGIPFRFYSDGDWARRLYGTYNGPIQLFNNRMQKDVKQAYLVEGAQPIDFVYGYNFKDRGNNLQRFVRRDAVAERK